MKGVKYIAPYRDHCYSSDTEVLTDTGWKFFYDLKNTDRLATLADGCRLEYHPPERIISLPWEGDLLRFRSEDIDLLVSPNHQLYIFDGAVWRLEKAFKCWGSPHQSKKTVPQYPQEGPERVTVADRLLNPLEWLSFIGYYLACGSLVTSADGSYIVKFDVADGRTSLIAGTARAVSFDDVISSESEVFVFDAVLGAHLNEIFAGERATFIPRDILNLYSRGQLAALYSSFKEFCSKVVVEGRTLYATAAPGMRDSVQELKLKLGLSSDYGVVPRGYVYSDSVEAQPSFWSLELEDGVFQEYSAPYSKFERVFYEGTIYCAIVKNHTMLVRRNGKVVWSGNSGYGEASRNYILSLYRAGVPITIEPHCFEPSPPPVGTPEDQVILQHLENKDIPFDTVIIHLTPDLAPGIARRYPDKKVINYTVWETSALHPLWVGSCNGVDEIWVPSKWNVDVFKSSGVIKPVYRIHHGIDPLMYSGVDSNKFSLPGIDSNTFVFYSIMQWNSRKNPDGLLRAYFNAFTCDDQVRLVLKAYVGRGLSPHQEAAQIKEMISRIKQDMGLSNYPRLSLITNSLSTEQMRALHLLGDAYVTLPHAEGFGLTSLEAGLAGNPVIMTGMGGNMEYMTDQNSYPVSFSWDYVSGMGTFNRWYLGTQQWAQPNLIEAAHLMRHVYENREEAKERGKSLQSKIVNEFSWDAVSKQMIDRLLEV